MSLYKGLLALLCAAVPGWTMYFWSNEFLKDQLGIKEAELVGDGWNNHNLFKRMMCGGVAGMAGWAVSYPFDVVMTEIMCTTDRKLQIREAFKRGYKIEGCRYFYKGLSPCLIAAFVASVVTLPAFEYMDQNWMPKKED